MEVDVFGIAWGSTAPGQEVNQPCGQEYLGMCSIILCTAGNFSLDFNSKMSELTSYRRRDY